MSNTHDHDIANQVGANFRTDLNNVLDDIQSSNSGASEPITKVAYKLWVDTTNNKLKLRNGANNAWITLGSTETNFGHATAANPSLTGTVNSAGDIVCNSNTRIKIPVGTTGQRPSSPATGDMRYNSTVNKAEIYNGSGTWLTASIPAGGSTNNVLKNDGGGGLAWDTVANLQNNTTTVIKGAIAFNGTNGSTFKSSNLSVSRTGTGTYTITIDSSIRNGTSYGVVIGNIDESGSRGVGDITNIDAVAYNDNFRVCFVSSRSTNSFTIRAYRFDPDKVGDIADDKKLYGFRRVAQDPDYISVAFFS